jgi:hypothetical protein
VDIICVCLSFARCDLCTAAAPAGRINNERIKSPGDCCGSRIGSWKAILKHPAEEDYKKTWEVV